MINFNAARRRVLAQYEFSAYTYRLYDSTLRWIHALRLARTFDLIERHKSLFQGADVLEIGCSDLFFQCLACELGVAPDRVTGVDVFWENAEAVASRTASQLETRFGVQISLFSMPVETFHSAKNFDIAIALETLEHVGDESEALCRISKCLGSRGYLLFSAPVEFGPLAFSKEIARLLLKRTTKYSFRELQALFRGHIEKIERVPGDHKGYDYRKTIAKLKELQFDPIHQESYPLNSPYLAYGYIGLWRKRA